MQEYNPERVVLLRQVERLTQKTISEKTGVSQGTLSKIENRQVELTAPVVSKIAAAFDYPVSFFEEATGAAAITSLTYRHTSSTSVGAPASGSVPRRRGSTPWRSATTRTTPG